MAQENDPGTFGVWSADVINAVVRYTSSRMNDPGLGLIVAAAGGGPDVATLLNRLKIGVPGVIACLPYTDGSEFATRVISEAARINFDLSAADQACLPEVHLLCVRASRYSLQGNEIAPMLDSWRVNIPPPLVHANFSPLAPASEVAV